MSWRSSLLLAGLAFVLSIGVARFQPFPGYLDSDYYLAGGLQLANGRGFTEPYIWNYLDDPQGLPHPSHTYWMPLASIVAAAGMWLIGQHTYVEARLGFIVLATLVPVIAAALAYSFSQRRDLALISGLLAVFSIYYVPFLPVTDNYSIYLALGGVYLLAMGWQSELAYLALGGIAGLLTLARSDGILWLGLTLVLIIARRAAPFLGSEAKSLPASMQIGSAARLVGSFAIRLVLVGIGFALITGPWFWRTYSIFGTALAPGGARLLWLKNYDETFSFPANQLTFNSWLAQGWVPIVFARLAALRWNLLNAFAAQGGIFLLPFILIGLWQFRQDQRVRLGALGWLGLLFVMTFVFPFAGARGGFFHAGAAFQCLWWALAPMGLETGINAARRRNIFTPAASKIFQTALVGLAIMMTAIILAIRVLPGWGEGEQDYPQIEAFLIDSGIATGEPVIARNPPGYYIMTGRPAIVVPYGDRAAMLAASNRFHTRYLIIEAAGAAGPIRSVYEVKDDPQIRFLGELDGTRIFRIQP